MAGQARPSLNLGRRDLRPSLVTGREFLRDWEHGQRRTNLRCAHGYVEDVECRVQITDDIQGALSVKSQNTTTTFKGWLGIR